MQSLVYSDRRVSDDDTDESYVPYILLHFIIAFRQRVPKLLKTFDSIMMPRVCKETRGECILFEAQTVAAFGLHVMM